MRWEFIELVIVIIDQSLTIVEDIFQLTQSCPALFGFCQKKADALCGGHDILEDFYELCQVLVEIGFAEVASLPLAGFIHYI
jgi:hypothetical protein